ncbi:MAG: RluA family pseudouridine synthase [Bacteroidota bacterium]
MKRKLDWLLKSKGISIIFEDEAVIVLDKPSPFLVLPDRYDELIPNLYGILNGELGKIFVVHQIDKETSGLIVFAKTPEVHKALSEQFEGHTVKKTYEAIVRGHPERSNGRIELPIREKQPGFMALDWKKGKESITGFKALQEFEGFTHLEVTPETGRMHQIRVHLKLIGLPIVGDPIYGDGRGFFLSEIKAKYKVKVEDEIESEERPLLARTALHAAKLGFVHPVKGGMVMFESKLPKDMRSVVRMLAKYRPKGKVQGSRFKVQGGDHAD